MKNINKIFDSICNSLLALGLGISFTLHGIGKFPLPPERMVDWFAGIIVGGLLYLLNLIVKNRIFFIIGDIVTRLSALGVVIIMIGAILIAHSDWLITQKLFMSEQIFLLLLGFYFTLKGNNRSF